MSELHNCVDEMEMCCEACFSNLESENARLRAELELEKCVQWETYKFLEQDRDAWKAKASKLAEALEKITRKASISRDPHDDIQGIVGRFQNIGMVAKQALAEFKQEYEEGKENNS